MAARRWFHLGAVRRRKRQPEFNGHTPARAVTSDGAVLKVVVQHDWQATQTVADPRNRRRHAASEERIKYRSSGCFSAFAIRFAILAV